MVEKKVRPSVGEEEAVLGSCNVGGGGVAVGVAGVADEGFGGGGVGVHLKVAGVVVGGEPGGGEEGHVGVIGGDLECGRSGRRCRVVCDSCPWLHEPISMQWFSGLKVVT